VKIMAHMKITDLVMAGHEEAKNLPPAAATLMKNLAARLDVVFVALGESLDKNSALEAENLIFRKESGQ